MEGYFFKNFNQLSLQWFLPNDYQTNDRVLILF